MGGGNFRVLWFHFCRCDKIPLTQFNSGYKGSVSAHSSWFLAIIRVNHSDRSLNQLVTSWLQLEAKRDECMHAYTHAHPLTYIACAQLNSSILRQFRTPWLGNGVAHIGLSLPTPVNVIKTISHKHAQRPTQCKQFHPEILSLAGDLGYVKLTKIAIPSPILPMTRLPHKICLLDGHPDFFCSVPRVA